MQSRTVAGMRKNSWNSTNAKPTAGRAGPKPVDSRRGPQWASSRRPGLPGFSYRASNPGRNPACSLFLAYFMRRALRIGGRITGTHF